MNAKWPLLLKIQLMGLTGINKAKNSDDPRIKRKAAGMIAVVALVGALLLFYMTSLAVMFCQQGLGERLPALIVALSSVIIFAFTLFQGRSLLFAAKDYDMVLSLPIPKWQILFAKLLCAYLVNLAFTLAVALPMSVVYFLFEGFSFGVMGTILLATLTAPLLPLAFAATLSTVITAVSARFRFKNLLQSVLGIALFVGVMLLNFSFSFSMGSEEGVDMNALFEILVGKIYPPALFVDMTLSKTAVWGVFAFAGISIAAGVLFVAVLSVFYTKINSALLNHGARVAYKAKDVKSSSAFAALVKREFKRLFSCSGYLLNGTTGALLLILAAIALLFVDIRSFLELSEADFEVAKGFVLYMGIGLTFLFIGMSCPSCAALSLEGKSRGILFSMPVSARQILLAKAVPTLTVNCIAGFTFAAIFCIKMQADMLAWIIAMLTVPLFSAFIAQFGSFLNYKFPKYDWTTETQAIKNSIPSFIIVFGSLIFGSVVIAVSVFAGPWMTVAVDGACVVLNVVLFLYFKKAELYV